MWRGKRVKRMDNLVAKKYWKIRIVFEIEKIRICG